MTDSDARPGERGSDVSTDRPEGDDSGSREHPDDAPTGPERPDDVPAFDDEYFDSVSLRLMYHYDQERDVSVEGRRFPLYASMEVLHERHVMHPALTFGHHEAEEHVFADRVDRPTVADVEALDTLGDRLAEEWIDADETHYSTDFTFVIVAKTLPGDVREHVETYENRTLLKYGYFGHYETNLVVVVPERETSVASANADVEQAFRDWEPIVPEKRSRLDRFLGWLSR